MYEVIRLKIIYCDDPENLWYGECIDDIFDVIIAGKDYYLVEEDSHKSVDEKRRYIPKSDCQIVEL